MDYCRCDVSIADVRDSQPPVRCIGCGLPWSVAADLAALTGRMLGGHHAAGGLVALLAGTDRPVLVEPGRVVPAPGLAEITACDDHAGADCLECGGSGYQVWRACVRCGDIGMWQYDDDSRRQMSCRRCGVGWDIYHPGWIAQRVPEELLTAAAA